MTRRLRTFSTTSIFAIRVERGLKDVREGRVIEQAELERRMAKWLGWRSS
jgi:hypothetical protein